MPEVCPLLVEQNASDSISLIPDAVVAEPRPGDRKSLEQEMEASGRKLSLTPAGPNLHTWKGVPSARRTPPLARLHHSNRVELTAAGGKRWWPLLARRAATALQRWPWAGGIVLAWLPFAPISA